MLWTKSLFKDLHTRNIYSNIKILRKFFKKNNSTKYESLENIKKEIMDAKKTFQKYRWPSIDVTRKSVEETAASIIKIHEIYLNNDK